jgi:DNA-binding ferritin-like protein
MENMPLSVLVGGGSMILTLLFFVFRGEGLEKFKKIFGKGQEDLKKKIENLEVKEVASVVRVKEAEDRVKEVKEKASNIIKQVKKEIEETGKISNTEKLMEEFNEW